MVEKDEKYDLIIVGGGCSGYSAAMYASRFNLKTLIITVQRGGLITTAHLVENWPGEISLKGYELSDKLEEQVKFNNVEILDDKVVELKKLDNGEFELKTSNKELTLYSKTILLATGTNHKSLDLEEEKRFRGKGVSYCATCDGFFYKNKIVGVVGGADSAIKEAFVLSQTAKKVYMFIRTHLKGEPINNDKIESCENIEPITGVCVEKILGEKFVEGVKLDNGEEIAIDGLFVSIGLIPQNSLAKQLNVELNKRGEIITNTKQETNIKGLFASGDITNGHWKQAIVASAQGSVSAHTAFEYITSKK